MGTTTLQAHRAHLLGGVSPIALTAALLGPIPQPGPRTLHVDQHVEHTHAEMQSTGTDFSFGDRLFLAGAQPNTYRLRPTMKRERWALQLSYNSVLVGFDERGQAFFHGVLDLPANEARDTPENVRGAIARITKRDRGAVRDLHDLVASGLFDEEAA